MKGINQRPIVVGLAMATLLCAGLSGCESGRAGLAAPAWSLTDIEGTKHALADHEEKVVVLAFWSSDDLASRLAAPDIQAGPNGAFSAACRFPGCCPTKITATCCWLR